MRTSLVTPLLVAWFIAMTSPVLSQSAPLLTPSQAAAIARQPDRSCVEDIDNLVQSGPWAAFMHACKGAPAAMNSIAHYAEGKWTIVCGHGDDVLPADMAVAKCPGLTLDEAMDIGMPPQDVEGYHLSDPIQSVEKYYALWARQKYSEMYQMLSASYRSTHPYAGWLGSHNQTATIYANASAGSTQDRVNVFIYSSEKANPNVTEGFAGTWSLVKSNGVWHLDAVTLKAAPIPH